jgi:hypothetical protein
VALDAEGHPAGPGGHVVAFYGDDGDLAGQVSDYLLGAIRGGGTGLVIATPAHRLAIEDCLVCSGIDVPGARAAGSYVSLDAEETLRRFLVGGWPSPAGFWQVISPLARGAVAAGGPVRVFGEMVALLWDAGLAGAAIELEALWNELAAQYPFSLFCAYPERSVTEDHLQDALAEVCRLHAAVVGGTPQTRPD